MHETFTLTRNNYGGDRTINRYKVFYESNGSDKYDMYAGVAIAIREDLLKTAEFTKSLYWNPEYYF